MRERPPAACSNLVLLHAVEVSPWLEVSAWLSSDGRPGHLAAFVGTAFAFIRAALAMIRIVLAALGTAGVADVGTKAANLLHKL
jgi:hypothetical protein